MYYFSQFCESAGCSPGLSHAIALTGGSAILEAQDGLLHISGSWCWLSLAGALEFASTVIHLPGAETDFLKKRT